MKNKNLQPLLISLILTLGLVELPLLTLAQSQPPSSPTNQPNQPQKKRSTWEAILRLFTERPQRNLGSRGVCLISPGILEDTYIIWNNRPLFVWKGKNSTLEVRVYSPFDPKKEQEVIWRTEINSTSSEITSQLVQYTGLPLEFGQIYDWEIFDSSDKSTVRRSFQIMNNQEYQQISEELENLESQLKSEQATDEEIALERANYFAQKNLWSDMLQEMSSVQNPSPEFTQRRQELLRNLCEVSNKFNLKGISVRKR